MKRAIVTLSLLAACGGSAPSPYDLWPSGYQVVSCFHDWTAAGYECSQYGFENGVLMKRRDWTCLFPTPTCTQTADKTYDPPVSVSPPPDGQECLLYGEGY
ncbi:MAG TPA: hypothetical protein VMT17_08280 [Anaeromyxobacteraceae bacterium]|nr:hypothetical protein [Anaeromyxobacteraceae bacterium]